MGCFLSCFRGHPDPAGRGLHDPLVRKTRLGDAFLDDHHDDDTAKLEASGTPNEELGNDGGVDDDLRREVSGLQSAFQTKGSLT